MKRVQKKKPKTTRQRVQEIMGERTVPTPQSPHSEKTSELLRKIGRELAGK